MKIVFVADAAAMSPPVEGMFRGLRDNGHDVRTYGPGLEHFCGAETPLHRAFQLLDWGDPAEYPDLVWCTDYREGPDWRDVHCPRVLVWIDLQCFEGIRRAQEADALFLFARQYLGFALRLNPRATWFPYGVDESIWYPDLSLARDPGVVCMGQVEEWPKDLRASLRTRLGERVVLASGLGEKDLADLYRRTQLTVDWHAERAWDDRTLMAMACGACHLTNRVPGLLDTFQEGKHLLTYEPEKLSTTVLSLLVENERRERIAATGCKEVLYRHTWRQRVADMLAHLRRTRVLGQTADDRFRQGDPAR